MINTVIPLIVAPPCVFLVPRKILCLKLVFIYFIKRQEFDIHLANTAHNLHLNDIKYHLDLAVTLISSVILIQIWGFDIFNFSTPQKLV